MKTSDLQEVLSTPGLWKISGPSFKTWIEVGPDLLVWSLRADDKTRDNRLSEDGWSQAARRGGLTFHFMGPA